MDRLYLLQQIQNDGSPLDSPRELDARRSGPTHPTAQFVFSTPGMSRSLRPGRIKSRRRFAGRPARERGTMSAKERKGRRSVGLSAGVGRGGDREVTKRRCS